MKNTLFLTVLLCGVNALYAAVGDTLDLNQGYVADGVTATFSNGTLTFGKAELQSSTRFYDSQKGWVAGTSYGDSLMCWAHTSSNMIQYWQSYYGVFYKGNQTLPYGSDYTRQLYNVMNPSNSPVITDPMRLNVMQALYNSGFLNSGNEVKSGTDWFFTWVDAQGGFYSDYFGATHQGQSTPEGQTATITGVDSLSSLKTALLPALGITESNGTYTQTESGLIAHLNVTNGSSPHTLTCYGLTTNADGSVKSVIIADSDDCRLPSYEGQEGSTGAQGTYTPKLTQLYVKPEADGKLALYSDAACTTPFISGYTYYISGITQINTPEVLKNMLAEYSDTVNEAQVWNGKSNVWEKQTATTETLPTEATGWDISVDGDNIEEQHHGYYHTYAMDGRDVIFDAHGMKSGTGVQQVTVNGTVTPGAITVKDGGNYHLQAGTGAAIDGSGDVTIEANGKLSSEVNLGTRNIIAKNGALFTYAMGSDTALTGKISGETGSIIQFRNRSSTEDISYSYDMNHRQPADSTVSSINGTLIVGDYTDTGATTLNLTYAFNSILTVEHLKLYNNASLNAYNDTYVTESFSSLKNIQAASSIDVRSLSTSAPTMKWNLNLSAAKALIMETATDMNQHLLDLGTSTKSLTLDVADFQIIDGQYTFDLFTNVGTLKLGSETLDSSTTKEWTAATFFTGAHITNDTLLVFDSGVLQLRGLSIPEPTTATLSLLAMAALASRRRRL